VSGGAPENLISVIIPAYNAARYLAKTLASVTNQSHLEIEIIVIDDGSTDDTVAIIETARAADPRISLVKSAHRGVSHARNLGIARSHGAYIAPLDADDLWKRDKLSRQLELLRRAPPGTGVAYCWAAGIDDNERVVLPVWNASRAEGDVLHEIVQSGILSCGSTPLIRKEYVLRAGGYDETLTLAEDWKFYIALAGVCRFAVIPECLTGYRIREDSSSLDLDRMQQALDYSTRWIRMTWPDLPKRVYAEREFTLNTYLAFMAIRAQRYASVPGFLSRAIRARPSQLFGISFWQLPALTVAHASGLRRYEWALWQTARKFEQ
jgi:glycosyltransferase involved in cell wall biosynthesis